MPVTYGKPCNKQCSFEVTKYEHLRGGIRATIYEAGQPGPQKTVSMANDWYIKVQWYLEGGLRRHICGKFCVSVTFESMGPGPDFELGPKHIKMKPCGNGKYKYVFKGNDLPLRPEHCGQLYRVGVKLTSLACGRTGHISGHCDIGNILILDEQV